MMSLNQKGVAVLMLVALNAVTLVVGVGFGGIIGLALYLVFLLLSATLGWKILSM